MSEQLGSTQPEPSMRAKAVGAGAWLLGATVIAGGLGYVLQILPGLVGSAGDYATFGVAWAVLYFVIGMLAGLQQEVSRAAEPGAPHRVRLWQVGVPAAVVAALLVLLAGSIVELPLPVMLAMALGTAGYACLALITGLLYGASAWRLVAATMVLDALLRTILAGAALLVGAPLSVVFLAVSLPFGLTVLAAWPWLRRATSTVGIDMRPSALAVTIVKTVLGSAATAVLVSGFPFVLRSFSAGADPAEFGAFIYAFTLSRAPLVIAFLSMQTFLVRLFKAGIESARGALVKVIAAILGVTALVAALAWLVGPWLLTTVAGPDYELSGVTLGLIVLSAAPMAALCVTGPLVLAQGRHSSFTIGWVLAALVSILLLLLPLPIAERALVAISVGPVIGAVVHVLAVRRG